MQTYLNSISQLLGRNPSECKSTLRKSLVFSPGEKGEIVYNPPEIKQLKDLIVFVKPEVLVFIEHDLMNQKKYQIKKQQHSGFGDSKYIRLIKKN